MFICTVGFSLESCHVSFSEQQGVSLLFLLVGSLAKNPWGHLSAPRSPRRALWSRCLSSVSEMISSVKQGDKSTPSSEYDQGK